MYYQNATFRPYNVRYYSDCIIHQEHSVEENKSTLLASNLFMGKKLRYRALFPVHDNLQVGTKINVWVRFSKVQQAPSNFPRHPADITKLIKN